MPQPTRFGKRTFHWNLFAIGAVSALLAGACNGNGGLNGKELEPAAAPVAAVPSSPLADIIGTDERPSPTEVSVRWRPTDSSKALPASDTLSLDLVNETDQFEQGRLVVIASGLDGRLVERPLDLFTLAARDTKELRVRVADLPLQSEASSSFVVVQAEITRPDGYVLRVPSAPLYFHFQGGYREARFYSSDEVSKLAPHAPDPMALSGRVMEADGRWTDLTGPATQGPTEVTFAAPGAPPVPAPTQDGLVEKKTGAALNAVAAVNYTLCGYWRAQFVDSAVGEDIYPTTAWQDVPALFASSYVYLNGGPFWGGNLNAIGCATVALTPNTTYTFYEGSASMGWSGGPVMDNYLIVNGARQTQWVSLSFKTPASSAVINLKPTYNDDVVQVNAVSAAALRAQYLTDQGMLNGQHYVVDVHAPECGPASDPSCPFTSGGVVKVGVNVQQNSLMTHWKFMIGHELGHSVQYYAMGNHSFDYTWSDATALCRCSHVATLYGTAHCIQSRGPIGGGQIEGFAHAYSSRIFNNDNEANGYFAYYKPFLTPYVTPNQTVYPPMWFATLWDAKFMSSYCGASNKGIELDWMQFYYQLTARQTINKTSISQLFSIYKLACTGSINTKCNNQTVTWEKLRAAAQTYWGTGSALYNRFRDTGIAAGVNW
jgi:hypothetical protein